MNQKEFSAMLERERKDLLSLIHSQFWHKIVREVIQKRSFQEDFYLVKYNLAVEEVCEYLRSAFLDLGKRYDLTFFESNDSDKKEFRLRLCNYAMVDDLSIVVRKHDIMLRIFPYNLILKQFRLDEYKVAEKVAKDLCQELFGKEMQKFQSFHEEYKTVAIKSQNLTQKAVQIAQNSIKTIYEASAQKNKSLVQRNLYSTMLINGISTRIYHKDFMENPAVLLKEINTGGNYVNKN